MFRQILRVVAIGVLAGSLLFFFPFLIRALLFLFLVSFLFRMIFRMGRWSHYRHYRDYDRAGDPMAGSFMSRHYYHKPGITPLYQRPASDGAEERIRVS